MSAVVVVAIAVGSPSPEVPALLPWALAILVLDLVATELLGFGPGQTATRRDRALLVTLTGACVVGAAIATSQAVVTPSPWMPLLLVPAFRAGQVRGRLAAGAAVATSVAVFLGVSVLGGSEGRGTLTLSYLTSNLQWPILAVALGVVGDSMMRLKERRSGLRSGATPAAHEAVRLLRRLSHLAGTLDGGFDAPAAAELLLNAVKQKIPGARMAVLVGTGSEPAVPLALRGIDRLPWPSPTTDDSVIGRVWRTGVAEAGTWTMGDQDRAVAAAPLLDSDGARIGIVIVDRFSAASLDEGDLEVLSDLAEGHSANLEVALIFASLRQDAAFEERERLAREMHDGIAQELVALGYRLDATRRVAAATAPSFVPALVEARAELSRLLTDLRLRIADLRLAVRPEQGLGAVVGARLQHFGAATGVTVALRLSESPYRLPAHLETLIYRLILDVLSDARNARGVSDIKVHLDVNPPRARLSITHDGATQLVSESFVDHPLVSLGADIEVQPHEIRGVTVSLALGDKLPRHLPYLAPDRVPVIQP